MEPITRTAAWPATRGLGGKRKSENFYPLLACGWAASRRRLGSGRRRRSAARASERSNCWANVSVDREIPRILAPLLNHLVDVATIRFFLAADPKANTRADVRKTGTRYPPSASKLARTNRVTCIPRPFTPRGRAVFAEGYWLPLEEKVER